VGFFNFPVNLAAAYQLLYRTTGSSGEAISTVTTILIPNNTDFTSLLSYQAEIDASWSGCFPSYVLQAGNQDLSNIATQYSMLFYISALSRGWIVAVPDHEGPNAAFGASPLGGHCVLDGIRAVLQSGSLTGISANARTVMWGYSGGALPTEWALEEHATYAPELSIAGAAMGGLAGNVTWTILNEMNGKIPAGLMAASLWGIVAGYPEISTLFQANLVQDKESAFRLATGQCTIDDIIQFANQDIWSYFDDGVNFLYNPSIQAVLDDITMGEHYGTPTIPIYAYQSANDEIVGYQPTADLYAKYCSDGANIQFVTESLGEHVIVAITGAAGALGWLIDRMNDEPVQPGCSQQTVESPSLSPEDIPILGEFVYNDLLALLGAPVGLLQ
jgi:hypothetical protein